MKLSTAGRIGGFKNWEDNREHMLTVVKKGGDTTFKRYKKSHMVRMAAKRWDNERKKKEAMGRRHERRQAGAGELRATSLEGRLPASHLRIVGDE